MGTIVKYAIGGFLLITGLNTMKDGVDVVYNGKNSRLGKLFTKKNSTVSVDTVEFEAEDE